MTSFRELILDHKPHEGKVLAALKADSIPEIWTELFKRNLFWIKAMFKLEFLLVIVKKVVIFIIIICVMKINQI